MEDAAGLKLIHPTLISIDRSSYPCIKSELRLLGGIIILILRRLELVDSLQAHLDVDRLWITSLHEVCLFWWCWRTLSA
jgi:hypothetical protein